MTYLLTKINYCGLPGGLWTAHDWFTAWYSHHHTDTNDSL